MTARQKPGPKPELISLHPLTLAQAVRGFAKVNAAEVKAEQKKAKRKRRKK